MITSDEMDKLKILKSTMEKPTFRRGRIFQVLAFENAEQDAALLGSGYILYKESGEPEAPVLVDIAGNKLPEGWYHLRITEEIQVIVPKRKQ